MLNWVVTARIGSAPKGWNGRQEESEEAGTRNKHWRGGILVSIGLKDIRSFLSFPTRV